VGDIIASLDVGTTKVCAMIAEVEPDTPPVILGVGQVPARGMRRGAVVNVQEVTAVIAEAVAQAERAANVRMASAFVGLSGFQVESLSSRGVVTVSSRSTRGVSHQDVARALANARVVALPHNREVIQVLPRTFKVDDQDGIRDPAGMQGFRLEVDALVVTAASVAVQNLVKCVQDNGIDIEDLVLQPVASGLATLTEEERELGVAVMDIGGGSTDVAIFLEGRAWHVLSVPIAGHHLTQDVAMGLRMPLPAAEDLKLRFGHVLPRWISADETVGTGTFGDERRQVVSRYVLAQILEARAEEILDLAWREVKASGYDGLLPAGVVLTGGTALLAGLKDMARERLQAPVRVGTLGDLKGLGDEYQTPAHATAVGLLMWGAQHSVGLGYEQSQRQAGHGAFSRLGDWVKRLLPEG